MWGEGTHQATGKAHIWGVQGMASDGPGSGYNGFKGTRQKQGGGREPLEAEVGRFRGTILPLLLLKVLFV